MNFWNLYTISFLVVQINIVILKLAGVVAWPWYEALMPSLALIALVILGILIRVTAKIVNGIKESWMDADNEKYARWLAKRCAVRRAQAEPAKSDA